MTAEPPGLLAHLSALTDDVGIFEHALLSRPRRAGGYCTDDAGRLLAVVSQLPDDDGAERLATVALRFLEGAHDGADRFRLRLAGDGSWTSDPRSDDAAGRALYGLGVAAASAPWPQVRSGAGVLFSAAAGFRSDHLRATGHAALGAVALLGARPSDLGARRLVADARAVLTGATTGERWPEHRLAYGNALLPEARLATAESEGDAAGVEQALEQLGWLVGAETGPAGHFSFTPVGGRPRGGPTPSFDHGPSFAHGPSFDQQPIEAWAMADACWRAYQQCGDDWWAHQVLKAEQWFFGVNDAGVRMHDVATAGGFDGLQQHGPNLNQGAESTLAFVGTRQRADQVRVQMARVPLVAARASSR